MKPEKEQLFDDLAADGGRREATLLAAAHILRCRRHWLVARQTIVLLILVATTALLVETNNHRQTLAQVSRPPSQPVPVPQAQELTDEQLLSLFPNTPVGLATLPNGKKLLLFLRPGDAAKYVTRL
ncbi:MAG: hypothetical protein ABSH48_17675 [Verrucomicrobiota bacterium]|jgi:hypothetical protein